MLPSYEASGGRRLRGTTRVGSSVCGQCLLRMRTTSIVTSVAAPERNSQATAAAEALLNIQQRNEVAQLNSMLSASASARQEQQADVPASTSGRSTADVRHDRPFLRGSRRRLRNSVSRSKCSTASFYGEYCNLKATQRMVSSIWERLMAQGDKGDFPEHQTAGIGSDSASNLLEQPDSSLPRGGTPNQPAPAGVAPDGMAASASPGLADTDGAAAAAKLNAASAAHTVTASIAPSRATSTTPQLEDGWTVSPITVGGSGGVAAIATTSAAAVSRSHQRVVLYLGPKFELQLPPPALGSGGGGPSGVAGPASYDEEDPTGPWSIDEGELQRRFDAPKPRRIRGCTLSSPEVVRAVSFGGGGGADGAGDPASGVHGSAATQDGRRARDGRPKGTRERREATAASDDGRVGRASSESEDVQPRAAGRELRSGEQRAEPGGRPGQGAEHRSRGRLMSPAAAAAAAANGAAAAAAALPWGSAGTAPRTGARGTAVAAASTCATARQVEDTRQRAFQSDLLEALVDRAGDAVVTERIQLLATVNRTGVTAVNFVLQALGAMGHVHALARLLTLQVALGRSNEHTYATAFKALHRAGRPDMALAAFKEACRSGRDLGPVACSSLLHIAAQERNIKLAWRLFDEMVAQGMTLNRYSYNCMAHIAAHYGMLDDTRLIYAMMKAEAAGSGGGGNTPRPDCAPDSYTYSALVRAALNAGRSDLLPALFNEMAAALRAADRAVGRVRPLAPGEGQGRLSCEVWGHFISAASRSGQPDLALRFFQSGIWELGLMPSREVYNVLLSGLAKSRPLPELLRLYGEMVNGCLRPLLARGGTDASGGGHLAGTAPEARSDSASGGDPATSGEAHPGSRAPAATFPAGRGRSGPGATPSRAAVEQPPLSPDHYTFNALLTAAGHHMADLATLERIRREMNRHGVGLNTFVGTSLINAYRRTPELGRAAEAAAAELSPPPPGEAKHSALDEQQEQSYLSSSPSSSPSSSAGCVNRVVAEAEAVMSELVANGAANSTSYICMAAFYATAQRPAEALGCVRQMMQRGLAADDSAWQFLAATASDAGQLPLVAAFAAARQRQQALRQQRQRQQHEAQRRAADLGHQKTPQGPQP